MKHKKGSLTVETALVLPVFLSLAISLISILEMMTLYARVEYALHETAREISLLAYPVTYIKTVGEEIFDSSSEYSDGSGFEWDSSYNDIFDPVLSETVVRAMFTEKFGLKNLEESLIKQNEAGIFFFRSDVINDRGDTDLIVTYKVEPLFNLFGVGEMKFSNRARIHSWIGYVRSEEEKNVYVYITENSEVYHTHRNCTHLRLKIDIIDKDQLGESRNADGKKYYPCHKCVKKRDAEDCEFYYITPYGEAYHTTLSCSGLKRTVFRVRLSEIPGKRKCERCASYKEGNIEGEDE